MPETQVKRMHGLTILACPSEGDPLRTERDTVDLIGDALGEGADTVLIPVERLSDEFFQLSTRVAGAIVQKFMNYRLRLVFVGDITPHLAVSESFRDFVAETNRGEEVWFVATEEELDQRLSA
jgi:hypothetical protein